MIVWAHGSGDPKKRIKNWCWLECQQFSGLFGNVENDIIFRDKLINDPMKLVKLTRNWSVDWAVLQRKNPRQNLLMLGARLIEQVASKVYKASQGWRAGVRRLMN